MPIISLLRLSIAPDAIGRAHAVISETLAATRAFDGCLGCDVLVDATDEGHVVVHERWESLAHDDAYRAWRATPEGASELRRILTEPPKLTRFTVADGV